jgi:hypothetical protein
MRTVALILSFGTMLFAVGCGPADVAGNYAVNISNGDNDCNLNGWDPNAEITSVPVVITQDGSDVQLDVQNVAGAILDAVVGSHFFNGTVGGSHISAELIGSVAQTRGACTYTLTLELEGDVNGDFIEGTLDYNPITNHSPDCGTLETCSNRQLFNGTRPPSE